ncbi:glutathione S-transferase-like [Metopolophium dirhodum]|uniref:glutathione S-transferase-like n=1 Tax=Metopolophium dirhodum TaxID=44670 RepID=UPI00298FF137|nr:glutathione S-transferase-like [Metopolophium dirhodum]XP_060876814.1 glutathione S-transferase-like [Metopolophium dirhodum]XP_060876815.1 glutathione S-transferase-like [Metopolophium dirhodum]XP_060876816.1 glutathione S-transferase-like [Metopolophium dirhodum]
MAVYKLTYFNFPALAEPIRFLLSYLEIDFEDVRFEREQWPSIKPTMPFGKVPILEIDGKVLNQSVAISRYLSKKAGLAGSDEWESLLIDIAVDNVNDLRQAIALPVFDPNEESKAEKYVTLINETIPLYMNKFENTVGENDGYFVNGKLSLADIHFVAILDFLSFLAKVDLLEGRPNLQAHKKKIFDIPQIKSWIAKRPAFSMKL